MYSALRIFWLLVFSFVTELSLATIALPIHDVDDTSNLLRVSAHRMAIDHRQHGKVHPTVRNNGSNFPLQFQRAINSDGNFMNQDDDSNEANNAVQQIERTVHHVFFNYDLTKNLSSRKAWPNDVWFQSYLSWKKHFPEPEYHHIFWPADKLDHFFKTNCSQHWKMYQNLEKEIEKADMSRYCLLWRLGGIYADLDYEPVRNFYHLLRPGQVNLIQSPYIDETVQNSLMASPVSHPFWDQLMSKASSRLDGSVQKTIDHNVDIWRRIHDEVRRDSPQTLVSESDESDLGAQLMKSEENSEVLWSSGPKFLSTFLETVRPSMFHVLPCSQFQPLVRSGSPKKHCKKLSIAGIVNNSIQGIHWGTQLWSGGTSKAELATQRVFRSFRQAILAIDRPQLHGTVAHGAEFDKVLGGVLHDVNKI